MKRPPQDPEALLATLVRASRATTPTAEQAERLERKLSPWLDPKPGIPLRPFYAATALLGYLATPGGWTVRLVRRGRWLRGR